MWFVLNKPEKKSQGMDVNLVVSLGNSFFFFFLNFFVDFWSAKIYVRYKPQFSSAQRLAFTSKKKKKIHNTCKKYAKPIWPML